MVVNRGLELIAYEAWEPCPRGTRHAVKGSFQEEQYSLPSLYPGGAET